MIKAILKMKMKALGPEQIEQVCTWLIQVRYWEPHVVPQTPPRMIPECSGASPKHH